MIEDSSVYAITVRNASITNCKELFMEFTKSEAKEWARKSTITDWMESFSPRTLRTWKALDEEGIRHDVRHNIDKGHVQRILRGRSQLL